MKPSAFRTLIIAPFLAAVASPSRAAPEQSDLARFVLPNWRLEQMVRGDLTGDRSIDAVLVLQETDPAKRIKNDGLGAPVLDTNPRRLIVLAGSSTGYRQIARSDRFIPPQGNAESSCLADPLEDGDVKIERGLLRIKLNYWLSCGGWGVTVRDYKFRYERGHFRLIGFDGLSYARNSGQGDEVSIDYLRGRIKRTSDLTVIGDGDGVPPKISWSRIKPQRILLEDVAIADCDSSERTPNWC